MKIGLLGHGVVGSGVTKIIDSSDTEKTDLLEVARILVKSQEECTDERCTTDVEAILSDPSIDTIAECMGGNEPAHTYVRRALEEGKNVVTSNKKMLANHFDELMSIAQDHNAKLYYEATAGGGIPWIANLKQIRRIETPERFRGIFNGTTNYILYHMSKESASFAEVLKQAQELGYAERDPKEDIDGDDVCYKVMLSSVAAFGIAVSPSSIPTYGIRNVSVEDLAYAKANERTLKLIGQACKSENHLHAYVIPCFLKNTDYLSCIPENLNGIEVISDTLGPAGFIGQGAGSLPTAHAVVQDLLTVAEGGSVEYNAIHEEPVDNSQENGVFYVRTANPEVFSDVIGEKVSEHALVTSKIAFSMLEERIQKAQDEKLFVAKVEL